MSWKPIVISLHKGPAGSAEKLKSCFLDASGRPVSIRRYFCTSAKVDFATTTIWGVQGNGSSPESSYDHIGGGAGGGGPTARFFIHSNNVDTGGGGWEAMTTADKEAIRAKSKGRLAATHPPMIVWLSINAHQILVKRIPDLGGGLRKAGHEDVPNPAAAAAAAKVAADVAAASAPPYAPVGGNDEQGYFLVINTPAAKTIVGWAQAQVQKHVASLHLPLTPRGSNRSPFVEDFTVLDGPTWRFEPITDEMQACAELFVPKAVRNAVALKVL